MPKQCWAVENRCVFSARVKAFCSNSGAHSAGVRLFQVVDHYVTVPFRDV